MSAGISHIAVGRRWFPATRGARWAGLALMLFARWAGPTGTARADEPISIEALNQLRSKWEGLRGATLQIEGRCLGFSETRLKMTGCDLIFVFEPPVTVPGIRPKNVDLTGSFEMRERKLVFVVTRMKPALSDFEVVRLRRAGIETNQPQQWYDLAAWAAARAAFYEDQDLKAEAFDLNEKGLLTEYRQVPADGFNQLYRLADKVTALDLPDRLRARLLHDAARRELAAAGRSTPPDFRMASTHILERLSGSNRPVPLDADALELKQQYQADPLAVYESADDARRQKLHRFLYTEAALAQIQAGAAEDGSNGDKIASAIEQNVPEFNDLAEQFRQREIDFRIKHTESLTREQLLKLAERLVERQQEQRAHDIKARWLKNRELAAENGGLARRMEVADDYDLLLNDRKHAAEIVIGVLRDDPLAEFAREKLEKWNYRYDRQTGDWFPAAESSLDDKLPAVMVQGQLQRGMTAEQVRASLGQAPGSIQRFASRGGISELWIFPDLGVSVLLTRRQPAEPKAVVDFGAVNPPDRH